MSIADIGREAAQASTEESDEQTATDGEYENIDVSDAEYIRMHPGPTAVEATITGLRYFPAFTESGDLDTDARGEVYPIITDVEVPDDDSLDAVGIFESTTTTGDDYKVVNTDNDGVDVYDVGVSVGQMFESTQVDTFGIEDGDIGVLKLSTGAGRSVARTLDVKGLPNADVSRTEDGTPDIKDHGWPVSNNGLVETHPDNGDDFYEPPRFARDPQLRPDVAGQRVIILVQEMANVVPDYTGNAHWATVLGALDEERQMELAETYAEDSFYNGDTPESFLEEFGGEQYIDLAPTAEFEPDDDLVRATTWLEWSYPSEERVMELREEQGVTVDN